MAFNPWSSAFHGTDETIAYNLSFMGDQLLRATSLSAWDKSDPGFRNFISQLSLLWKETHTRDPSRCWAVLQVRFHPSSLSPIDVLTIKVFA
jgi:hypothetical protein